MNTLIINSANDSLTLLLKKNNNFFFCEETNKLHHNEVMLTKIDELLTNNNLKLADIDEFGVVIGPGSFTGIRVGIATIKAFRDALNKPAKGINNLDLLFSLATSQNKAVNTVAILGSRDSYFVAKLVNNVKYIYEHNLTKQELLEVADGSPIGMFVPDETINSFKVEFNAEVYYNCFLNSTDNLLVPVYYQLSQAENEKLKRAEVNVSEANIKDLNEIANIEKSCIINNTLSKQEIENMLNNKSYKTFTVNFNGELVGFIILQLTDEANIVSIAVKKEYRNLGLATKLINEAFNYSKSNNINTISLEVAENNIPAYLLYKKLGFTLRRKRKNYYADGATCLEMAHTIPLH